MAQLSPVSIPVKRHTNTHWYKPHCLNNSILFPLRRKHIMRKRPVASTFPLASRLSSSLSSSVLLLIVSSCYPLLPRCFVKIPADTRFSWGPCFSPTGMRRVSQRISCLRHELASLATLSHCAWWPDFASYYETEGAFVFCLLSLASVSEVYLCRHRNEYKYCRDRSESWLVQNVWLDVGVGRKVRGETKLLSWRPSAVVVRSYLETRLVLS